MFMGTRCLGSLVCAAVLLVASAVAAEPYEDPQRRYWLDLPPGWSVTVVGESVRLGYRGSGVFISPSSVETAEDLVVGVADQVAAQWSDFGEIEHGSSTIAGRKALFALYSGINLKGTASFLKVTVVPGRPFAFVLIATVPMREFAGVKPGLDQIEQSFSLPAAAPGPQPAPDPGTRLEAKHKADLIQPEGSKGSFTAFLGVM
jgi:hypothetical protein